MRIIPYSTKVSRDKTFAVRSPCEYIFAEKLSSLHQKRPLATQFTTQFILKFAGKHSRFKGKPRKFCPSNGRTFCTIR